MRSLAVVASAGARTALGLTAAQTGFLLRTGITAIAAAPIADAKDNPITMCFDATIDPYLVGEARVVQLSAAALRDALAPLGRAPETDRDQVRLLLCLDERYGRAAGQAAILAARIHAAARALIPDITLEISARGPAGPAYALPRAIEAMNARQVDAILLGGVHTDYDPRWLARLEAAGRLFATDNLDSIIPGEAAAFVLLTRDDVARRAYLAPSARLRDLGTGFERATPDNDESAFEAQGLTAAIRMASDEARKEGLRIGWSIADHLFESRRISEWQAMITRTHVLWGDPHVVEAPAQRIGHLGAAALPLSIALVAEAYRRGYAPAPLCMAFAGSDAGERGALLLSAV